MLGYIYYLFDIKDIMSKVVICGFWCISNSPFSVMLICVFLWYEYIICCFEIQILKLSATMSLPLVRTKSDSRFYSNHCSTWWEKSHLSFCKDAFSTHCIPDHYISLLVLFKYSEKYMDCVHFTVLSYLYKNNKVQLIFIYKTLNFL